LVDTKSLRLEDPNVWLHADAVIVDAGARARGLLPSNLPLRNSYMPAARNHDALWYASVSFASIMNQIFQGKPVDPGSLRYKGQAIRAINSNLHDSSRQTLDETIAAVQCVASIEVRSLIITHPPLLSGICTDICTSFSVFVGTLTLSEST
jgi:hypothetical protein